MKIKSFGLITTWGNIAELNISSSKRLIDYSNHQFAPWFAIYIVGNIFDRLRGVPPRAASCSCYPASFSCAFCPSERRVAPARCMDDISKRIKRFLSSFELQPTSLAFFSSNFSQLVKHFTLRHRYVSPTSSTSFLCLMLHSLTFYEYFLQFYMP